MKVDLKYFENQPETISPTEVEREVNCLIQYSYGNSDNDEDLMDAWVIIADKQYHTYQPPSDELKDKIFQWIVTNWTEDIVFQSSLSMILGNFAIEKGLIFLREKLNDGLPDEIRTEIIETIQELGNNINDPYYDLKE